MTTRTDIIKFLEANNIKKNDTVLIHTSLKYIGGLDGGADMLIDAFCEYLSDGLFLIPTHTWDNVTKDSPVYDVRTTPSCIGTLPNIALKRKDGVRSLHPTHSVVAFGKRAEEFIRGEEKSSSPAPVGGVWSRLYDEKAKILLIGVGHDKNTYFHAVDERLKITNRLNPDTFKITIKDYNGTEYVVPDFHTHYTKDAECCVSEYYPNYKKALEYTGAVTYSHLGNALVYVCDAVKCTDTIEKLWKSANHDLCFKKMDIPKSYYEN